MEQILRSTKLATGNFSIRSTFNTSSSASGQRENFAGNLFVSRCHCSGAAIACGGPRLLRANARSLWHLLSKFVRALQQCREVGASSGRPAHKAIAHLPLSCPIPGTASRPTHSARPTHKNHDARRQHTARKKEGPYESE